MSIRLVRVGDLATQLRGVTYRKQDASTENGPGMLPVLRAGNITDQGVAYENLVYVPASIVSPKQILRENDILIAASSGSLDVVGKAARVFRGTQAAFGAFCKVLRPCDRIDPGYFANYFKTPSYRQTISSLAAGVNINNLRGRDLDDLQIPLPALAEQKRIAAILDAADALRAKRRESLAQLDKLIQSTFLEMFGDPVTNPMGWEVYSGGQVFESLTYGTSKKSLEISGDGDLPVLRIPNVTGGSIDWSDIKYTNISDRERETLKLRNDDLLFVRTNGNPEYIGRCARFSGDCEAVFASYLIRGRLNRESSLSAEFLKHQIEFPDYRHRIVRMARTTAGNYNLATTGIRRLTFISPPLDLQRQFAEIVGSIERQKARMRAHLEELDTLFASLQDRAFKGEL